MILIEDTINFIITGNNEEIYHSLIDNAIKNMIE